MIRCVDGWMGRWLTHKEWEQSVFCVNAHFSTKNAGFQTAETRFPEDSQGTGGRAYSSPFILHPSLSTHSPFYPSTHPLIHSSTHLRIPLGIGLDELVIEDRFKVGFFRNEVHFHHKISHNLSSVGHMHHSVAGGEGF